MTGVRISTSPGPAEVDMRTVAGADEAGYSQPLRLKPR
jgi:hypothetical protein